MPSRRSTSTMPFAWTVSVQYRLALDPSLSLKESFVRRRRRRMVDYLALDGLSLAVRRGETFGVIGGNGAGKTTLLNVVARIIHPSSGRLQDPRRGRRADRPDQRLPSRAHRARERLPAWSVSRDQPEANAHPDRFGRGVCRPRAVLRSAIEDLFGGHDRPPVVCDDHQRRRGNLSDRRGAQRRRRRLPGEVRDPHHGAACAAAQPS